MARSDPRRDAYMPDNALSDEMLDAYFQALARRAPTLPDVPMADEPPPPTPVPERLPSADELMGRPDLRNPPTTPPEFLGPPPARNEAERMIEGSMGLDYSEPGRGPAEPPPTRAGALPPRSLLGPYEEDIIPSSSPFLGPQSDLERQELERHNRQVEGGVNALMLAGSVTAPGAIARGARIAGEGASVLGRAYGGTLARAPRTVAATTAGVTTAAGAGQAEPPSELDTARAEETRRRTRITALEAEDGRLQTRFGLFDSLSDPRRVTDRADRARMEKRIRDAQAALNINQDGTLGPDTRAAIAAERRRIESERKRVADQLETARADLQRQEREVARIQGGTRLRDMEPGFFERWGPLLGIPAGYVVGSRLSRYLGGRVEANVGARTERANELLTPPGRMSMDRRIGRANQFWTEGGSREAPFSRAVGRDPPWVANPNALPAERLYRRNFIENFGPGLVAGGAGAAEAATGWLLDATERVERAWATVRANPNDEAALQELAAARRMAVAMESLFNFGRGTMLGTAVSEAKRFVGSGSTRPDISRAEGERGTLDRMLGPRNALTGGRGSRNALTTRERWPAGSLDDQGRPIGGRYKSE